MDFPVFPGQIAPSFTLPDLYDRPHCLADYRGAIAILDFWSAECGWCERSDSELLQRLPIWGPRVRLITIASNPNESTELIARTFCQRNLPLLLLDRQQEVANLYGAIITPQLFVVDTQGILRYSGAFDDMTFHRRVPTRPYLQQAVEALLAGQDPDPAQTTPYGCAIVRQMPSINNSEA